MRINKSKKMNPGFGLLEALIASAILVSFAAGVVVLGNISLRNTVINKHKLQASYLAQDAIESIRNMRDSNWVDENPSTNWDHGIDPTTSGFKVINKKTGGGFVLVDGKDNNDTIKLDKVDFTRKITISNTPTDPKYNGKEKQITVTVSWNDYNRSHNITMNSYLTDWMSY